mgnify:CR=1 FL=1
MQWTGKHWEIVESDGMWDGLGMSRPCHNRTKLESLGVPEEYIKAEARIRLQYVMPGETPYQVQLPPGAAAPGAPTTDLAETKSNDPWYTALWHTIAEVPQGIPPTAPPSPPRTRPSTATRCWTAALG